MELDETVLMLKPEEYSDAIVTQTQENRQVTEYTAGDETMRAIEMMSNAFNHARDAFINASRLGQEVRELQAQVTQIRQDLEATQSHNRELDIALADTRKQRDEALASVTEWRGKHLQLDHDHESLKAEHSSLQQTNELLQLDLQEMRHQRDEARVEAGTLSRELEEQKALVAQLREHMDKIGKLFNTPALAEPAPAQGNGETEAEAQRRRHWEQQERDRQTGQFGTYPGQTF